MCIINKDELIFSIIQINKKGVLFVASKKELAVYRRQEIFSMIMFENITDYEIIAEELGLSKGAVSRIVNNYLPEKVAKKVAEDRKAKRASKKALNTEKE
jgi:predicted transcriptional regulator